MPREGLLRLLLGGRFRVVSAETQAALEAALAEHIADSTDGGMVTDWCAVVAVKHLDDLDTGTTEYRLEANVNQPLHISTGLLAYAIRALGAPDE